MRKTLIQKIRIKIEEENNEFRQLEYSLKIEYNKYRKLEYRKKEQSKMKDNEVLKRCWFRKVAMKFC